MAMECIKNCCKIFLYKEKETETQVIKVKVAQARTATYENNQDGEKKGVSDDYLLSKLPPDNREVPFVVPLFKPSYIQPKGSYYSSYQEGLHNSARRTFADRKAALSSTGQIVYNPDSNFHQNLVTDHVSPGSNQRVVVKNTTGTLYGSVWDQKSPMPWLSNSLLDLTQSQSHMQRFDSVSSVQSCTSSMKDSLGSSRSLESIALSGDERELGKLTVRLSYQEALEQIWITLEQCKDLYFPVESGEQQKIGIKGIITLAKPVQFKSSIKEASPEVEFIETFVFALSLTQLRTAALVFRLQTHVPRKRTLGECALSLRQLGPQETQHWLYINPLSKAPICHAELHLATCFQPVSGRIQFQVLGAQNLPASSTPLSQSFYVKTEMHSLDRIVTKKKTRAKRSSGGQVQWAETFLFPLVTQHQDIYFSAKLYSRSSVRRKCFLGQVHLGFESPSPDALEQWRDTIIHPEKVVAVWHRLSGS